MTDIPIKRGRGRPRKIPLEQPVLLDVQPVIETPIETDDDDSDQETQDSTYEQNKPRRGRPPKYQEQPTLRTYVPPVEPVVPYTLKGLICTSFTKDGAKNLIKLFEARYNCHSFSDIVYSKGKYHFSYRDPLFERNT